MTSPSTVVSTRWRAVALGMMFLLASLVIWDGTDRRAVDATRPLSQGRRILVNHLPQTLKIGSFNIHSGKGTDGKRDLSRIAELLSDQDFVGLYEVRALVEADQPNQAAAVARRCNATWLFAPSERQWWSDHFGNGLMNRLPIHSIVRIPLVNTRGKAYRNAILSTVALDHATVRVIAVHIDRESDRRLQLQTVVDLFLGLEEPCVLMGDLNTTASDPILENLRDESGVRSPLHECSGNAPPASNIDWIFTRGLKTVSAVLVENPASDHPYLKAELLPLVEK